MISAGRQLGCEKCGGTDVRRYAKDDRGWRSDHTRWLCRSCVAMTEVVAALYSRMRQAQRAITHATNSAEPAQRPIQNVLKAARWSARRHGLPSTLTNEEWRLVVSFFEDRCAYCGERWTEVEHATPLSRGGGTTAGNCLPSCDACNDAKHLRTPEELLARDLWPHRTTRLESALAWLQRQGRPDDRTTSSAHNLGKTSESVQQRDPCCRSGG
jgi:hypothetical protein